jgi:transposase
MLALTPHIRIFVAIDPIDFRAGMNRLAALAKELFQEDPQSGILFVFRNKKQSEAKLLVFDGDGYYLIHRRLSCGRFSFWPKTLVNGSEPGVKVEPSELMMLLQGGDPRGGLKPSWKRIKSSEFEKEEKQT